MPVTSQPRFIKRINKYLKDGYDVTVASFEREYLSKNELPESIRYISLGVVEAKQYHKRIFNIVKAYFTLIRFTNKRIDLYVLSQDMLVISLFLPKKLWLFEIGDVRVINNRIINKIYKIIQSKILKKVDQIIVTSPKFKEYVQASFGVHKNNIKIVENKMSRSVFPANNQGDYKTIQDSNFTLGIIGLFRYENIIHLLESYRELQPKFNIQIWGTGPLKSEMSKYFVCEKINYNGEFKYPDDLRNIYNQISISFVMYDNRDLNVRLALPNKLYESLYFKKPMIVSDNTFLGEKVNELDVGICWDQSDMVGLVQYLDSKEFIQEYNNYELSFNKIDLRSIYQL